MLTMLTSAVDDTALVDGTERIGYLGEEVSGSGRIDPVGSVPQLREWADLERHAGHAPPRILAQEVADSVSRWGGW
jgi:hypothetical protein